MSNKSSPTALQDLPAPVARACREINALVDKLATAERKVEQYQIAIGQHIAAIKKTRPNDWRQVIEVECKLKRSRAYELLAIANGTKTVEQIRAAGAKRVREHDERKKETRPLANGRDAVTALVKVKPANASPFQDEESDSGPPGAADEHAADARRRGFMWRASEAVRFARFDDLAGLKVDEEMRGAVKDAADAWAEVQAALAEREAEPADQPADAIEPDDYYGELA
jgi:hypothetical protein